MVTRQRVVWPTNSRKLCVTTLHADVKTHSCELDANGKDSHNASMLSFGHSSKTKMVFLIRSCLVIFLIWYFFCLLVPMGSGKVARVVSFPAGNGVKKLATELKRNGIIRSTWHFAIVSRLHGQAHCLKAGDYRFTDAMTVMDILRKVVNGDVDFQRFTLPEGYSTYQAAELLQQQHLLAGNAFLRACSDSRLLTKLGSRTASVEGYLYPATYNLSQGETAEQLVAQMTAHFEKDYSAIVGTAVGRGMSRHDVVTLASMIEKEAVSPAEKPLISSVFHNRLRIGMPLQSDPTAVYGVRAFCGTVTKADIKRPSPYNTYLHPGLPPGPIGNPGADALKAALHPADTPYLYFVARQDGSHQFSRTLQEHNQAVQKYLKH